MRSLAGAAVKTIGKEGTMGWLKNLVAETAEEVFRAEAERIVRKVAGPAHAAVRDISGAAVRRAARPLHDGIDRLVDEAARRAASTLVRELTRGTAGRRPR
jgi:hypothetical protein